MEVTNSQSMTTTSEGRHSLLCRLCWILLTEEVNSENWNSYDVLSQVRSCQHSVFLQTERPSCHPTTVKKYTSTHFLLMFFFTGEPGLAFSP